VSADCTLLRGTLAGLKAEELDEVFALLSTARELCDTSVHHLSVHSAKLLRASPRAVHAMGECSRDAISQRQVA